jgi:hypothetical protein
MNIARRSKAWLLAGLAITGLAWATLSNNFSYYWPSRNETATRAFQRFDLGTLPAGTVVSIINGDTGEYENYEWDGTSFVDQQDGGTVPGNGSGSGGPEGGGGGGGGGTLDPGWGNVPVCRGSCPTGEVTVLPPQPV